MEEAPSTEFVGAWDTMDLSVKLEIEENIVAIESQLLSVSFTRLVEPLKS
jgi:hypothetical protein